MAIKYSIHNKVGDKGKFFYGRAPIYMGERKYNVVDTEGHIILNENYEWIGDFSSGIAPVRKEGRYAWINTEGQKITDFIFSDACNVLGKPKVLTKGGKLGELDISSFKVISNEELRKKKLISHYKRKAI